MRTSMLLLILNLVIVPSNALIHFVDFTIAIVILSLLRTVAHQFIIGLGMPKESNIHFRILKDLFILKDS
jgi:hypothetical protein